jgi:hypothetical protein
LSHRCINEVKLLDVKTTNSFYAIIYYSPKKDL